MYPEGSTRLSQVQIAKIAFARIEQRLAQKTVDEAALEDELQGEDIRLEMEPDSLQARMVAYLQNVLGIPRLPKRWEKAQESQRNALQKVRREARLGLHPGNQELWPLVEGFTNYELFLLNKVAVSDDPSKPLREQALIDLFNRKLRNGRGYDLIEFLTARRNHREKRAQRRAEIFNEKLLVIALLWTDPQIPLWLMPSAGAVKIVDNVFGPSGGRRLTKQAYNKLCRDNQLQRLEDKRRNRDPMGLFIRLSTQDSEGRDLRRQLETVMGVPLSAVRRGRRKMSAD